MLNREDFEVTDEPLRVTLPQDRGISVSIDLTEAETDALLAFAHARGLGIAQTAHDLLLEAMVSDPAFPLPKGDRHARR